MKISQETSFVIVSRFQIEEFSLTLNDSKHHWRMWHAFGLWRAGKNSGGSCSTSPCRHGCYYWRNPQFVIELTPNRSYNSNRLCMMIIALMQKPIDNLSGSAEQYIQIRLFKIKSNVQIVENKIYKPDEVERISKSIGKKKTLTFVFFLAVVEL